MLLFHEIWPGTAIVEQWLLGKKTDETNIKTKENEMTVSNQRFYVAFKFPKWKSYIN